MPAPTLTEVEIRALLDPFQLDLAATQIGQISTYLDLMLRWNAKMNLTSIRKPEECVTRHFGESLYLSKIVRLRGALLDIGSGAGFPGLALRILFPDLTPTLLEPVGRKRAFLREVARACEIGGVEVRPERLDAFARRSAGRDFDVITARGVGQFSRLVPLAFRLLKPSGKLCLWVSHDQGGELRRLDQWVRWTEPQKLPLSRAREIWLGERFT